ncbi:MAG: hypothetical protein ACU84Q_21055 [Gammaproteobacteria bacterium]
MTEAETLELISLYYGNAIDAFTIFISFTFAYLTVAYFVGAALTRFQASAASGLYILSSSSAAVGSILPMLAWSDLLGSRKTVLGKFEIWDGNFWIAYMGIIYITAISVSLYFMFDVRRRAASIIER